MGWIVVKGHPCTIVSFNMWTLYNDFHEYSRANVISDNAIHRLPGLFHLVAFLVFLTESGHGGIAGRMWITASHVVVSS